MLSSLSVSHFGCLGPLTAERIKDQSASHNENKPLLQKRYTDLTLGKSNYATHTLSF